MNVLVTGGLGHIGSKLIKDLSNSDDIGFIRILDNLSTQRYCSLFNLPENVRYEFIEGDIRNEHDMVEAMRDIDIVFHLAAITDAPSTFNIPKLTEEVNFIGTKNVVECALKSNVKKIIYPSTTSVYGPTTGIAVEDCRLEEYKPASPYAKFKLLGETEIIKASKENGLDGVVLRFGTIYGASAGIRFHTAINKFIFLACTNRPITVWEDALDQKRPYLDISDAIRAFMFMMEKNSGCGEIFNVITENATVREVIDILRIFTPNVRIAFTKSPILNQTSYFTDDSKIRKLGFMPEGNMTEGIRKTIELLKNLKVK